MRIRAKFETYAKKPIIWRTLNSTKIKIPKIPQMKYFAVASMDFRFIVLGSYNS